MSSNIKIRSSWAQLVVFLATFGGALFFYSIFVGIFLYAGGAHASKMDLTDPAMLPKIKVIQAFYTIVVFGFPGLFYALQTFRREPLLSFGFRPPDKTVFYLLGIMILLFCMPFESWLGEFNKHIPLPVWMLKMETENDSQVIAFIKVNTPFDIVINLLIMAVLPGICEEVCFRGGLQRILIQIFKRPWVGIVVSAALFSAIHGQFQGFLPRMLLGVLLGAVFWYSQSLWTSILGHVVFNGLQVILAGYNPKMLTSSPEVSPLLALISLTIVVGLLVSMRKLSAVSYSKVYPAIQSSEFDDFMGN